MSDLITCIHCGREYSRGLFPDLYSLSCPYCRARIKAMNNKRARDSKAANVTYRKRRYLK